MSEIIDQFYTPLLIEHGFIRDSDNQQYGAFACRGAVLAPWPGVANIFSGRLAGLGR